jgi:hypothetical protein
MIEGEMSGEIYILYTLNGRGKEKREASHTYI